MHLISIEPPGPAKERLFALQKELKLLGRGRLAPRRASSLWPFLGETPSGQVGVIQNAMTRAAGSAGAVGVILALLPQIAFTLLFGDTLSAVST